MDLQTLMIRTREAGGKKGVRKVRNAGSIPGVLYGGDGGPVTIEMNGRIFEHMLHSGAGQHAVVQLDVEDKPELSSPALLKAVQYHPVRGNALHADFLRIRLDERIVTVVPLRTEGRPAGVIEGGVLDYNVREIEVECLALDVPEAIVVDVTELNIGDSIRIGELTVPDNVTVMMEGARPAVTVLAPRVLEEAEVAEEGEEGEEAAEEGEEGEEAAEPEVIGEKKDKKED